MRKFVFILITIVLYSCSQEDNLTEENITVDFTSSACDFFIRSNALFPDNIIDIEEGDDLLSIIGGLNPAEEVTLYFKSGVHLVPTIALANGNLTPYSVLDFRNFAGIEIVGDGACSEIRQADSNDACSVRLIHIKDSKNIKIHNLFLNGNRDNLCETLPGEQGNNIRIRDSEDILIRNISSLDANGDALNIGCSDNIIVENSFFDSVNRNTLTLGWNGDDADGIPDLCVSNNIIIRNNTFSNADTQYIDFEHGDSYKGVQIINNDFLPRSIFVPTDVNDVNDQYAIAFTNVEQHNSVSNVLALNTFHGNRLTFISSENISIRFNDSIGKTRILGNVQNMIFRGNSFKIEPTQFYADDHIFNQGVLIRKINSLQETENIQFNNNEFYISNFERGIEIRNAKNIQVKNNNIVNVNAVQKPNINTNVLYGIRLMAEFNDEASAYINGNTFTNWPDDYTGISTNNSLIDCTGNNCD
ncbi:hypothetical protein [Dokdonia sp.]|uniref:hypothetical protein n=1 Tax=Dokdonia sp. TaxID=2024995 RepID=UPI0032652CD9